MTGPYAQAAALYWDAGWRGVLPLPPSRKKPPPVGYTGHRGLWPSRADVQTWIDGPHGHGNIALRMPDDVIGVDVDAYEGKLGGDTLARLEAAVGPLPPTCVSTSRGDRVSGIRLFRAPTGLHWYDPGPDIEVIQRAHRYVVAPPSAHPEGRVYEWFSLPHWRPSRAPFVDALPELPEPWVQRLTTPSVDGHNTSGWTDPDLDRLLAHGIVGGCNQDDVLRDVAWKLHAQNAPQQLAHTIWQAIVDKTPLTRPDEPWTDRDFRRHWTGADKKQTVTVIGRNENDGVDGDEDHKQSKSVATKLIDLAQSEYSIRLASDGTVFAVPLTGPRIVYPLRGGRTSLRAALARRYFQRYGKAANQQALADALLTLEGFGQQDENAEQLHLRVAATGGVLWLDLGDQTGRAVRIDAHGWRVTDDVPVLFRRTSLTAPLPEPARGGNLDLLWTRFNAVEEDRPLVVAALVAALMPDVPHVILGLFGEHGSAKTTAAKQLVRLIDPSPAEVRKAPRDQEQWVTAASGSWVVALDNLSNLPDWLSDALCRASTGEGDVRRRLYTDSDLAVFAFLRWVIITGIDLGAVRGDFADRQLAVDMHNIPEDGRAEESDLWRDWNAQHPQLLGALLDVASRVIAVMPTITLDRKPRMADFYRVLCAVDAVLGTSGARRYLRKAKTIATDSLTDDEFITAIDTSTAMELKMFTGTSAELLAAVKPTDPAWRPPKGWPASARAVTAQLRRQAPVMRKAGWIAEELSPGHDNAVRWQLQPPASREKAGNPDSQDSPRSRRESASHASDESRPSPYDRTDGNGG
jgi:hypothetical protein